MRGKTGSAFHLCLLAAVVSAAIVRSTCAQEIPAESPTRWWKGNLHTHSLWSDGNDFPEMISEWYRTHGYHFLALSDHNVLAEGQRWMPAAEIARRGGADCLAKYLARYGAPWVETRGDEAAGTLEVRLQPLEEYRALVESRGEFLLIQGEEITDHVDRLPVHMNASNIIELVQPLGGTTVKEAIANNLRAVEDQAQRRGREVLVHVNHPNYGYAITAEDLAAVVNERFFEVYNGHPGVAHLGDADHPGVEHLWDLANTIRIAELKAPPLLGLATDDTHDYHGGQGTARPGRGWQMVRATHLTPETLIQAIKQSESYASTGVTLAEVRYDAAAGLLELQIEPDGDAEFVTQFVGTLRADVQAADPAAEQERETSHIGRVLAEVPGVQASYRLTGEELYVRAVVTSSRAHVDPSFAGQQQQAWTQPVGWEKQVEGP
jgi:hypothetical protein